MIIAITCLVAIVVIVFVLGVRPKDLPEPEPVSPFAHLDERKTAIYENLRDLQFEYRVGKLSDHDYQLTKTDLQKELAKVHAEVDRLKASMGIVARPPAAPAAPPMQKTVKKSEGFVCPHCAETFDKDLKFCGECGKPMKAVSA